MTQVRLSDIIAPAFWDLHADIRAGLHTHYDLYGGRGSCKSSEISIEIPLGITQDPTANAIVFRKVASTLRNSVFDQIGWGIDKLGMAHLWRCTGNPMRYTYMPTGQQILFFGLDDPLKLKSVKARKGYFKYLWFEELAEFKGMEEIRNVEQSVLRGGNRFIVFKSFNPPISANNWANVYVEKPLPGYYRHHSTYLDVPPEWLGQEFLNGAEILKEQNPRHYEHEYLGIPTGTGGEIFTNLDIRPIKSADIASFDNIFMGIDWGWYPDPFQWTKMHFHAASRTLYIYDSYRAYKTPNLSTWEYLRDKKGVTGTDLITADSAEKKSVDDYRAYGALCRAAVKGPGSREYSYKWLQSLARIVIDPERCPEVAKEFREAEYERNKDGEVISGFPDGNDHAIDSVRYAMERYWKRKGQ